MPHALAETITQSPTESEDASAIRADALRAEAWAGEPFLRAGEEPDVGSRSGNRPPTRTRRRARRDRRRPYGPLDPSGRCASPCCSASSASLSERPPHLASGTELRRHQVDALAGMLTELIAATQKGVNGGTATATPRSRSPKRTTSRTTSSSSPPSSTTSCRSRCPSTQDPGAVRRYRFRHPTASGQDDRRSRLRRGRPHRRRPDPHAPPPARRPVPAGADRARLRRAVPRGGARRPHRPPARQPDHDPDVRVVRPPRRRDRARRLPARHLRRGAHGPRREDLSGDPARFRSRSTSG